jgi:hypothetical protein
MTPLKLPEFVLQNFSYEIVKQFKNLLYITPLKFNIVIWAHNFF